VTPRQPQASEAAVRAASQATFGVTAAAAIILEAHAVHAAAWGVKSLGPASESEDPAA
jgi:hypothetical protein